MDFPVFLDRCQFGSKNIKLFKIDFKDLEKEEI